MTHVFNHGPLLLFVRKIKLLNNPAPYLFIQLFDIYFNDDLYFIALNIFSLLIDYYNYMYKTIETNVIYT